MEAHHLHPAMAGESAKSLVLRFRHYGALADAVYESTESAFWSFLSRTAKPFIDRSNLQMVSFVSEADRESPAHALILDHQRKEILVVVRCVGMVVSWFP